MRAPRLRPRPRPRARRRRRPGTKKVAVLALLGRPEGATLTCDDPQGRGFEYVFRSKDDIYGPIHELRA
jgi:hypothetical protein